MRSNKRWRLHSLVLISVVMLSIYTAPLAIRPAHAAGSLYVSPAIQPSLSVGQSFSVKINVSSIDPFDTWDITVKSNYNVIVPTQISVAGDIFGSPTEFINCVNGVGVGCLVSDTQGIAHSAATSSSGLPESGNGFLFTITYQVVGSGYSDITIPPITSANRILYQGNQVVHTTTDGVYGTAPTNLPVADFTFSPVTPIKGDLVTFNASSSSDPNAGASIVKYDWSFTPVSGCPSSVGCENVTFTPVMVHRFTTANDFVLTLVITDNLGLSSREKTAQLTVFVAPVHRLVVDYMSAFPYDNILPGTLVNITARVNNKGTYIETGFNITILLEGRAIKTFNSTDTVRQLFTDERSFLLDTTGWKPDTYELVGATGSSSNSTPGAHVIIRIIVPYQGSPIPFTMAEFAGIIVGVLVALGIVRILFGQAQARRRLRAEALS